MLCRSSWILRTIITSLSFIASAGLLITSTPRDSAFTGIMVGGPEMVTSAPIFFRPIILERATLLCLMSPIIATFKPCSLPFFSLIVKRSSSACVGCSFVPSPALIIPALISGASIWGAPEEECLKTIRSGFIACRFFAVSIRVSPFVMLLPLDERLIVSALNLFAASSKEARVRVLGS